MFGILKKQRKLKNIADMIGIDVHRQILSAMKVNDSILNDQKNMLFIAGYLDNFLHYSLRSFQTKYNTRFKYIKHICNGITPNGQLWKCYQYAQAAIELIPTPEKYSEYDVFLNQYEKGLAAGESSAIALLEGKQHSNELLKHLIGEH